MTPEQQDKYYRKHYGISLAEYNAQLEKQGGGCAICGRPAKTRALHADHDHAVRKLKIVTTKGTAAGKVVWRSEVLGLNEPSVWARAIAYKKRDAIQSVKEQLKMRSYRGNLCHRCNRGLQMFSDNAVWLRYAADYIEIFKRRLYGNYGKRDAGTTGSVIRAGYLVAQDARAVDPRVESTGRILLPGKQVSELEVHP